MYENIFRVVAHFGIDEFWCIGDTICWIVMSTMWSFIFFKYCFKPCYYVKFDVYLINKSVIDSFAMYSYRCIDKIKFMTQEKLEEHL